MMKKYFAFTMTALFLGFLLIPAYADLPTLSTEIMTGADTMVTGRPGQYIYAINFDSGGGILDPINGVSFLTVPGTSRPTTLASVVPAFSYSGTGTHNGLDAYNIVAAPYIAASQPVPAEFDLYKGLIYGAANLPNNYNRLTLTGLEEGKTYTLQIYGASWGTGTPDRLATISFDANGSGAPESDAFQLGSTPGTVTSHQVSIDQPGNASWWIGDDKPTSHNTPYSINYQFVAGSDTFNAYFELHTGNTFHLYGFSLMGHDLSYNPVIKNPSFEEDIYLSPHYAGANGDRFTGWTFSDRNRVGMAPAWTDETQTAINGGNPFATGRTIPDGKQCVFIQSDGGQYHWISQEVLGFDSDKYYVLSFAVSRRSGYGDPFMSVQVGNDTLVAGKTILEGDFKQFYHRFQPSGYMQTITFANQTPGDSTVLLDNIFLREISEIYSPGTLSVNSNFDLGNFKEGFVPYDPELKTGGALYEINFTANPAAGSAGILFGISEDFDGAGLRVNSNGTFQIFDGDDWLSPGSISGSGPYDVSIQYWVNYWLDDELNPEGANTDVWVDFFINDELLASLFVDNGFQDNYLSLIASGIAEFNDFSIWSTAFSPMNDPNGVPEPTTWGMLIFGVLGGGGIWGARRFRGK